MRFRSRGALWNGPPGPINAIYADSGVLSGRWQNMVGGEFVATSGPWSVQAEYMGSWLLGAATTDIGPLSTAGWQPPPGTPVGLGSLRAMTPPAPSDEITITLPDGATASKITVGLPITAQIETLPVGTIVSAAEVLMARGATEVWAMATHAVLSGPAVERLKNSVISKVVLTNTLPIPQDKLFDKVEVLSIAPLIADALNAVFDDTSVSEIFGGENQG